MIPPHLTDDVNGRGLSTRFQAEYRAWRGMLTRCTSEKHNRYQNYGGRGIAVCDEWKQSFAAFLGDMGARPSSAYSIDRIDVNGNYEPGNCRWATAKTQGRNRTSSLIVEHDGQRKCVAEWADELGADVRLVFYRIRIGWDPWEALTRPKIVRQPKQKTITRSAAGLCRICRVTAEAGKSLCARHIVERREYSKHRNEKLRKAK